MTQATRNAPVLLHLAREPPQRARTTHRNLQVFAVAPEQENASSVARNSALPPRCPPGTAGRSMRSWLSPVICRAQSPRF